MFNKLKQALYDDISKGLFARLFIIMLIGNIALIWAANDVMKENKVLQQQVDSRNELLDQQERSNAEKARIEELLSTVRPDMNPVVRGEWSQAFMEAGRKYNLDPKLLIGLSSIESGIMQITPEGYDIVRLAPCSTIGQVVKSCAGARGVMQVMPKYWGNGECPYANKPKDLRVATVNIWCGAHILAYYKTMYSGDLRLGLLAYNRGPYMVNRALRQGRDPANGYATMVLERIERIVTL